MTNIINRPYPRTTPATITHFPLQACKEQRAANFGQFQDLAIAGKPKLSANCKQIAPLLRCIEKFVEIYAMRRCSGLFSRQICPKIWWCSISEQIGECIKMERLSHREQTFYFPVFLWQTTQESLNLYCWSAESMTLPLLKASVILCCPAMHDIPPVSDPPPLHTHLNLPCFTSQVNVVCGLVIRVQSEDVDHSWSYQSAIWRWWS